MNRPFLENRERGVPFSALVCDAAEQEAWNRAADALHSENAALSDGANVENP